MIDPYRSIPLHSIKSYRLANPFDYTGLTCLRIYRRAMTNRVVQGRMVTAERLAELIEGEPPMEADAIEDADRQCPDCDGDVLAVAYMPSVTELVTGYKCQDCDWSVADR